MKRLARLVVATTASAALLIAVGGASASPGSPPDNPDQPVSAVAQALPAAAKGSAVKPAAWMGQIFGSAPDIPLGEMLIPGSHDAGSAKIPYRGDCSDIEPRAGGEAFLEAAAKTNPCGAGRLARAQSLSLGAQLKRGVRYLDLRVAVPANKVIKPTGARIPGPKKAVNVPLHLHHEYISGPLKDGLAQIIRFVDKHPKEQVILDFQHVDLPSDPQVRAYYYRALDKLLRNYRPNRNLGPVCSTAWSSTKIRAKDRNLDAVPIGRAWGRNVNLLVLFPKGEMPDRSCYRDRGAAMLSLWPNTESPAKSRADNKGWLQEREQRISNGQCRDSSGQQWCGLFVSQLQLTAQISTQAACIFSPSTVNTKECSLAYFAKQVNNDIAKVIQRWQSRDKLPVNIVMVDFINRAKPSIVNKLLKLNRQVARR